MPPLFDTYEPDARLIRQKVAEAIDAAEKPAAHTALGTTTRPQPSPEARSARCTGYAANEATDLGAAC